MTHGKSMERTLSNPDVDAIAARVVQLIGARLISSEPTRETPPSPEQSSPAKTKLAYTLAELSAELGIGKTTIWRLEARGLLRPVPYVRHKIYAREEVERFLRGKAGDLPVGGISRSGLKIK
jgi:hypothetical protein